MITKVIDDKEIKSQYKKAFKTGLEHLEYLMKDYLIREEKTNDMLTCGINCNDNIKIAYEEFKDIKLYWNKYNEEDEKSREFKHYVISFNHEESEKLGAETINKMTKEIVERVPEFKNFQIAIATHKDKKHIHNHILVNSVNILDGHKIQLSEAFLDKFKCICNEYAIEHNLEIPEKNEVRNGIYYNKNEYMNYKKGGKSKNEKFAEKIENIIKITKNKKDLFYAMKKNNMVMKWIDDEYYKDKLKLGHITIEDKNNKEKHRLETLIKKYNINISINDDLKKHFQKIQKIEEFKKENIYKSIKINKNDLIKCSNKKILIDLYNKVEEEIKNKIEKLEDVKFYQLNDEQKKEILDYIKFYLLNDDLKKQILDYSNDIINNSDTIKEIIEKKTKEIIIKAKENFNKDLKDEILKKDIREQIKTIIANKILSYVKYNIKNKQNFNDVKLHFLLKEIMNTVCLIDNNNLNNMRNKLHLEDYKKEQERKQDIEKAITY